jgi:hypothetical protein
MKQQRGRRSSVFIYKTITASSPFIEVDLNLTSVQMLMFIKGLKCVIPCQSRFSCKSIDQIVAEQYQNISTIVRNCLKHNRMSITDERAKQAFPVLERLLHELYSKQLSRKLGIRAQHEHKILRSIQRLIRRTDKSKVFYVGKADDFARKAEEYMLKTKAYEEITKGRCPIANISSAVQTLLDYLVTKNALTRAQRNKISPKLNNLELGRYHGLPKPHKVKLFQSIYLIIFFSFL